MSGLPLGCTIECNKNNTTTELFMKTQFSPQIWQVLISELTLYDSVTVNHRFIYHKTAKPLMHSVTDFSN